MLFLLSDNLPSMHYLILSLKPFLFIFVLLGFSGCYSFKGISIPPEVNTFFVEDFQLTAAQAPGDLNQRFGEALRNKIRNESRLKLNESDPDIVFGGRVTGFYVTSEAIREGNTVALNKLEIAVDIEYTHPKNEKAGWKNRSFRFFKTFDSSLDFQSAQESLIRDIFDQLTEDIFNAAFSQW